MGDILVVAFELSDCLETNQVSICHIFCLEGTRVNSVHTRQDLEF